MIKKHNVESLHFQSKFAIYILVIGILVAFSLHSMSEDRMEWSAGWGIAAIVAFFFIRQYQEKKIKKNMANTYCASFPSENLLL